MPWTKSQLAYLSRHYATTPNATMAQRLKHPVESLIVKANSLGLRKSKEFMSRLRAEHWNREDHPARKTWFQKGQRPAHAGLRRPGYGPGRMKETQFKKGEGRGAANHKWLPVGTIRQDSDGYLRIKVREPLFGELSGFANRDVWPMLHRHVWEKHNGPVPAGKVVTFRNGKKEHAGEIANLMLVSKAAILERNSIHNLPDDLRGAIHLAGVLKRTIRQRKKDYAELAN